MTPTPFEIRTDESGETALFMNAAKVCSIENITLQAGAYPVQVAEAELESCFICGEAFREGDPVYHNDDGEMHALCCGPEREFFFNDDEAPLAYGEPMPRPTMWHADPKQAARIAGDDVNDEICVGRFAQVMRGKLLRSREKGRDGWDDPALCSMETLSAMLHEHIAKGDPVDIAILAMMIHQRGGTILPAPTPENPAIAYHSEKAAEIWNTPRGDMSEEQKRDFGVAWCIHVAAAHDLKRLTTPDAGPQLTAQARYLLEWLSRVGVKPLEDCDTPALIMLIERGLVVVGRAPEGQPPQRAPVMLTDDGIAHLATPWTQRHETVTFGVDLATASDVTVFFQQNADGSFEQVADPRSSTPSTPFAGTDVTNHGSKSDLHPEYVPPGGDA